MSRPPSSIKPLQAEQYIYIYLVGGFNPFEKYARQNGSISSNRGENKKCLSCHHLVYIYIYTSLKTNMTTESHHFCIGDTSSFMVGFPASHVSFSGVYICTHPPRNEHIPIDSVCLN